MHGWGKVLTHIANSLPALLHGNVVCLEVKTRVKAYLGSGDANRLGLHIVVAPQCASANGYDYPKMSINDILLEKVSYHQQTLRTMCTTMTIALPRRIVSNLNSSL